MAPWVSSGQREKLMFELFHISWTGVETSLGRPWPPHVRLEAEAPRGQEAAVQHQSAAPQGLQRLTRFRPPCLALYKASSAALMTWCGVAPSFGPATPMETVTGRIFSVAPSPRRG